ncbi:MAG: IspD/TarI family cytidylyltransferase, partial [Bacillota bacterium]
TEYRAVTVGTRIKDTVKRCNGNNQVVSTLDREQLVSIQTPQAFEYELIVRAHRQYKNGKFPSLRVTDDASLVEALGQPVKVIEGSYENIKITTPVDLLYAKLILKNRED